MKHIQIVKDNSYWDYRLSWASTVYFVGSVGNASIKTVFSIPDFLWGVISAAFGLGMILIYALNFEMLQYRSSKIFWRSIVLFIVIYMFSAILISSRGEPLNIMITGTAFLTFAWWIPTGVFACSVYDRSILYNVWLKASYIISACCIVMYFFHLPSENVNDTSVYNMFFGFAIIVPLLIQINEFLNSKKSWLLLLVMAEVFMILIYANRGILLSLIFFIIYKFALETGSRFRRIIAIVLLILVTVFMLSSLQSIAEAAVAFLDIWGVESRSLNMLATGVVSDTSGRDEIWEICFKMISESPVLGWGLGGEYYRIAKDFAGAAPEEVTSALNPHNGIIQNLVCLGIFGGVIATSILLFPLFHMKRPKDRYTHDMILIFASASVIPICISASGFFIEPAVAIYLYLFYRRKPIKYSVPV